MREAGYYWVKYKGKWIVSEYSSKLKYWYIISFGGGFKDNIFTEIDENQIIR